jgi:hypothetical protein
VAVHAHALQRAVRLATQESWLQEASAAKHAYYTARRWAQQRHMRLPSVPLPQALHDIIQEWFSLVDLDCTGRLTQDELTKTFAVRAVSAAVSAAWLGSFVTRATSAVRGRRADFKLAWTCVCARTSQ